MVLFSRKKELEVQTFVTGLINANCPELKALLEGKRIDRRVNLTLVALVVPLEDNVPQISEAFTATTKDFSANELTRTRFFGIITSNPC